MADEGLVGEALVQRHEVGQVEPAVQRRQAGRGAPARQRVVGDVDVKVDHVEGLRRLEHHVHHDGVPDQRVRFVRIQPQAARHHGNQVGRSDLVAAGE